MIGLNLGRHDTGIAYLSIKSPQDYYLEVYQSERFTKKKHQGDFPFVALKKFRQDYPNDFSNLTPEDVALNSFHSSPAKVEELYSQVSTYKEYLETFEFQKFSTLYNSNLFQPGHHICHAYSAWGFSPFKKAIILVFDGCGSKRHHFADYFDENKLGESGEGAHFETLSVYLLDDGQLTPVHKEWTKFEKAQEVDHFVGDSLGNLFSLSASRIFGNWQEAGKVMGLAAFGNPSPIESMIEFQKKIIQEPFKIYKGKVEFDNQPIESFSISANIASSVQSKFENETLDLLKKMKIKYADFDNLILVGGCALNCLTNSRILDEKMFKNVFIPPFPNDEGIAIGAVLCLAHLKKKISFRTIEINELHAYLGRKKSAQFTKNDIISAFPGYKFHPWEKASEMLAKGEVVAIFQGPSEVGPRALGNRSLVVRPDLPQIKRYLNENIKFREDFRPYGATVLVEDVETYFEVPSKFQAPFMTFAPKVKDVKKQYLSGVTHHDGTCRIQTISSMQNDRYYKILQGFKQITGESVLLNTSLNIMNQPILEDLNDAKKFMMNSKVNYIVINEFLLEKHEN